MKIAARYIASNPAIPVMAFILPIWLRDRPISMKKKTMNAPIELVTAF
jgi:hypothetical protein